MGIQQVYDILKDEVQLETDALNKINVNASIVNSAAAHKLVIDVQNKAQKDLDVSKITGNIQLK